MDELRNCCRTCLENPGEINIFRTKSLISKLRACTSLQITKNDCFPDKICEKCWDSLDKAYTFRTQCEIADNHLQSILLSPKIEIEIKTDGTEEYLKKPFEEDPLTIVSLNDYDESFNSVKEDASDVTVGEKEGEVTDTLTDFKSTLKEILVLDVKDKMYDVKFINEVKGEEHKNNVWDETEHVKDKEKPIRCEICSVFLYSNEELKRHTDQHKKEIYNCPNCKRTLRGTTRIQNHIKMHERDNTKVPCEFCSKEYKKKNMQFHLKSVHDTKKVKCTICDKECRNNIAMKDHRDSVHGHKVYKPKKFVCHMCGRSCTTKAGIESHITRVHSKERRYPCEFCNKKFAGAQEKKQHERVHTGEKPYKCPLCGMAYAVLCNMKSHFRHNHKESNYKEAMAAFKKAGNVIKPCEKQVK